MAREFAKSFYHSKTWKKTRDSYAKSQHWLCERCARNGTLSLGTIVHHIEHLTPENINNTDISLSFSNLELVCRKCHAELHPEIYTNKDEEQTRYAFDDEGNLVDLSGKGICK